MAHSEDTRNSLLVYLQHLCARWLSLRKNAGDDAAATTDLRARRERLLEQQAALAALTRSEVFRGEELDNTLQRVTETAARLLGIERVSLWRYTEARAAMRCVDLCELSRNRHSAGAELQAGVYPAYFQALATSEAIVADDAHVDPRTCELSSTYLTPLGISAMMATPIHVPGPLEGVLCHEQVGPPAPWTPEDRLFGIAIPNLIALALECNERKCAEQELRKACDALQEQVRERTAELRQVNHEVAVLKASEECFRSVLRRSPIAVCHHDRQLRYTWIYNPHMGFTPEQVLGKTDFEILDDDLAARMTAIKRRVLETGIGERVEMPTHLPPREDTEFFDLVVEPLRDARGDIMGLACAGVNITADRQIRAALIREKMKAQQYLDVAKVMFVVLDKQGQVQLINRKGCEILGYNEPEILGKNWFERFIPKRIRAELETVFGQLMEGRLEAAEYYENPVLTQHGEERIIAWHNTLIEDAGQIIASLSSGEDITERKRAQAALRQAKEAAEATNRAKTEFLATMSHELRTPLNSVLGYAQLLRRQTGLSDSQSKALTIIQQAGEHLLGLIEEILDMAKIEAGTLELQATHFDLPRLLEDVAAIMRRRAEAKGLVFTSARWSELPSLVWGDERRLRQVLMNLLDNAIKYTREGGVALKVGRQEDHVRFLVEDTGIGIQPEHLSEIFAVFHQVRDPRAVVEGTGLGLAISQRLVHLMGGELHVTSTPGEGSRFWFDLDLPPVSAPTPALEPAKRTVIGVEGDKRKVLVVDDQEDNRSLLHDFLVPLGFEVHEAKDGDDGVREAERVRPDVILMDMRMPGLDGLEVTRQIRTKTALQDTVIIAISASAFEHNRAYCLEAGADDFLPKPFRQERLLELLCTHLGLRLLYATEAEASLTTPAPPVSPELTVPPAEQLQTLLDLTRRGDVKGLLAEAQRLKQLDSTYAPFGAELRRLAEGFQMKRLREWLMSLMSTP